MATELINVNKECVTSDWSSPSFERVVGPHYFLGQVLSSQSIVSSIIH